MAGGTRGGWWGRKVLGRAHPLQIGPGQGAFQHAIQDLASKHAARCLSLGCQGGQSHQQGGQQGGQQGST